MALIRGCLNVQFFVQNHIGSSLLPFRLEIVRLNPIGGPSVQLERNHSFYHCVTGYYLWNLVKYTLRFIILFGFIRIFGLVSNWKINKDFEQLFYYSTLCLMCIIASAEQYCIDCHKIEMCYLVSQRFKLAPVPIPPWENKLRVFHQSGRYHPFELVIYGMSAGFFAVPLIVAGLPFFRTYDPINLIINFILNHILIGPFSVFNELLEHDNLKTLKKVFVSFSFGFVASHGCLMYLSSMLVVVTTTLDGATILSRQLYLNYQQRQGARRIKFGHCLKLYRILQVLTFIADDFNKVFLGVMTGVGGLIFSWLAMVIVTMYSQVPVLLYLSCCILCTTSILLGFILSRLAAIPNRNGYRFKEFWREYGRATSRTDKRLLKSCPPIGFALGFIKNVDGHTAMTLADILVNCAATLILTKITFWIFGRD